MRRRVAARTRKAMDFILVELHLSVQQERHSSAFSASIFLADGA